MSPQKEESGPNSPPKQRGGKSWHPETSRLLAAGAGAMASQAARSNPCCVFPLAQAFSRSWEDGGRGKPLEIVGDPLETPAAAAEPGPASSHSLGLLWVVPAIPKGILCIRDHTQYVSSVYSVALYRWEKIWVRPWRQPEASHSHIPFFSSGRGQVQGWVSRNFLERRHLLPMPCLGCFLIQPWTIHPGAAPSSAR